MAVKKLIAVILLAAAILGGSLIGLQQQSQAVRVESILLNSASVAASANFGGDRWSSLGDDNPATIAEIYLFYDTTATVNTSTFVLQVSPDAGTHWINHSTASALATNLVTDTNTYTRTTIEGTHFRVAATLANTVTVTPTIRVVLR